MRMKRRRHKVFADAISHASKVADASYRAIEKATTELEQEHALEIWRTDSRLERELIRQYNEERKP